MKTIEQKAKAYDEALEQAKKELAVCGSLDCDAARQIFRFFPELRESEDEDERMSNIILEGFKNYSRSFSEWNDVPVERIIAYLERQKEQKVSHLHPEDYPMAPVECIKPAWSEEDEMRLKEALEVLDASIKYLPTGYGYVKDVSLVKCWLLSLRPSWKPSKEQIDRLFSIVAALRKDYCDDMADFLASLYEQLKKL